MTSLRTSLTAILFAAAMSVTGPSTSGFAFTAEAQQMCTGDAMRLCSSEIPNISRVAACMHRQRANLSAGCRAVMDRDEGAGRRTSKSLATN
jgi:hypothetical protein